MENVWALRATSLVGLACMLGVAWLCSEQRRRMPWRVIAWGMGLQLVLGMIVLQTPLGKAFFTGVKQGFDVITDASTAGATFVFGNLTKVILLESAMTSAPEGMVEEVPFVLSAVLAFKVLPVIIFVSALAAVLQHLRIIQLVVQGMAWVMRRTMGTSGAETVGAALLVFLGIESVSAVQGYVKEMTRSEIFTIMVGFLATIAASVMVTYTTFGAEAGHLLAASIMSAPAALVIAKIMVPELGVSKTAGNARVPLPVESHNVFDAAARGSSLGLQMALQVGALLIVFVGFIALIDGALVSIVGETLTGLTKWIFWPFAFVMGVPHGDIAAVSDLLATKSVFNEFLAYKQLEPLVEAGVLHPRSITIATYALCGFANPGSVGILIGALASMAPERRGEVAQLSVKAFVGGTLAAFTTACVAGLLT